MVFTTLVLKRLPSAARGVLIMAFDIQLDPAPGGVFLHLDAAMRAACQAATSLSIQATARPASESLMGLGNLLALMSSAIFVRLRPVYFGSSLSRINCCNFGSMALVTLPY